MIGGIVLFASGDDSESIDSVNDQTPAEQVQELADRTLTETVEKEAAGFKASYPEDWKRSEDRGIVSLQSPSTCTVISLSAPATAAEARRLRQDSITALRRTFKQVDVRPARPQKVGGLPTTGAIVGVSNEQARPVVIRLAVSRGKEFAHLTQVVLRAPPCPDDQVETGLIIGSIEFSK